MILLYNTSMRLLRRRIAVLLTPEEAEYLKDTLDIWIEGYRDTASEARDHDEVERLMKDLDIGIKIRRKVNRWL